MNPDLETLRQRGIIIVTLLGWCVVLALGLMALDRGEDAALAAALSAAANLIPTWCAFKGRTDLQARLAIGIMAAVQPALLLYAMQGTLWQIDMHLYFFVALAALALLWDMRPIITACAIILVHHAVLSFAAPDWVFWGGGRFVRVLMHALATVTIGSVLCWITFSLTQMFESVEHGRRLSEEQDQLLIEANAALERARGETESERQISAQAQVDAEKLRKAQLDQIAAEFETTFGAVTRCVAETAALLVRSTFDLKTIAAEADEETREVASNAAATSRAANTVAAGIGEMSRSIAHVAVNVGQQSELTARATARSGGGGRAIGSLSHQSQTIGEATRAIARIAERTNLLSLNAAIEAASAGASGRGFTIVAHEVKALAAQASQAASEIDAFLTGVRSGTVEAEHSFKAIDEAIAQLNQAARTIRLDVESQRQSAETIENYARGAAGDADSMMSRIKVLSERSGAARDLSSELETTTAGLMQNIRNLERSTESFVSRLKAA
ncbi:methyl-accepting chemotaxis protein [Qipengyuania sp. ASV99]|uniref:methyl-accepting chemotaxis protein n=1 Tax=Qipengyuania sp. ASV99 TaxID=3399681 RepID=UPI003A4C595A